MRSGRLASALQLSTYAAVLCMNCAVGSPLMGESHHIMELLSANSPANAKASSAKLFLRGSVDSLQAYLSNENDGIALRAAWELSRRANFSRHSGRDDR